jgi:COP9 signalosome complex subunit 5
MKVDPKRTISAGKVEIGAFRTYPETYNAKDSETEYQSIPADKIEDFGVHCKRYYPLDISYYKSKTDNELLNVLWKKYWVNSMAASPLLANEEYLTKRIQDVSKKLEKLGEVISFPKSDFSVFHSRKLKRDAFEKVTYEKVEMNSTDSNVLCQCAKDSSKVSIETMIGLLSQSIKEDIFHK